MLLGNFGEVVNVELSMDRVVSLQACHFIKFSCSWSILFLSNHTAVQTLFTGFFSSLMSSTLVDLLKVQLPKGYGYVEFKTRSDAEKTLIHMNGVSFAELYIFFIINSPFELVQVAH